MVNGARRRGNPRFNTQRTGTVRVIRPTSFSRMQTGGGSSPTITEFDREGNVIFETPGRDATKPLVSRTDTEVMTATATTSTPPLSGVREPNQSVELSPTRELIRASTTGGSPLFPVDQTIETEGRESLVSKARRGIRSQFLGLNKNQFEEEARRQRVNEFFRSAGSGIIAAIEVKNTGRLQQNVNVTKQNIDDASLVAGGALVTALSPSTGAFIAGGTGLSAKVAQKQVEFSTRNVPNDVKALLSTRGVNQAFQTAREKEFEVPPASTPLTAAKTSFIGSLPFGGSIGKFESTLREELRTQGFRPQQINNLVDGAKAKRRGQEFAFGETILIAEGAANIAGLGAFSKAARETKALVKAGSRVKPSTLLSGGAGFFGTRASVTEASLQLASQQITRGQKITQESLVAAEAAGIAFGDTFITGVTKAASTGEKAFKNVVTTTGRLIDLPELPGDIISSPIEFGLKKLGAFKDSAGSRVRSFVPNINIPGSIPSISPSSTTSFSTVPQSGKGVTNPVSINPSANLPIVPQPLPIPPPTSQPVPVDIPAPVDIPSSINIPADVPADIPSDTPADIPADIPSDIPAQIPAIVDIPAITNVPVITPGSLRLAPFFPGIGALGGTTRLRRKGRQRRRVTPQLVALAFNIRGTPPKRVITGLEFRPIPVTNRKTRTKKRTKITRTKNPFGINTQALPRLKRIKL